MNFVDKDGTTIVYIPVHPWCIQVLAIFATCCQKFNSMNILQHCSTSDFITEPAPDCTCNILVSLSLQHNKEAFCCKNVACVAAALNYILSMHGKGICPEIGLTLIKIGLEMVCILITYCANLIKD